MNVALGISPNYLGISPWGCVEVRNVVAEVWFCVLVRGKEVSKGW